MLKIIGNKGKASIVDAIQKYNKATKVYVYDEEPAAEFDGYFISSKNFSINEFSESVYRDIKGMGYKQFPVSMVVLYTNLSESDDIKQIESLSSKLEKVHLVKNVIMTAG